MRIVVSGTHASGKSTLISKFVADHPGFEVLPDPYELLDDADAEPHADMLFDQLVIAADRLRDADPTSDVIAERGPLDFLAYLRALDALDRPTRSPGLIDDGLDVTTAAMSAIDLLILLPLQTSDRISVGEEEDLELREATDEALLNLADDPDIVGETPIVEVTGSADERASKLAAVVREMRG